MTPADLPRERTSLPLPLPLTLSKRNSPPGNGNTSRGPKSSTTPPRKQSRTRICPMRVVSRGLLSRAGRIHPAAPSHPIPPQARRRIATPKSLTTQSDTALRRGERAAGGREVRRWGQSGQATDITRRRVDIGILIHRFSPSSFLLSVLFSSASPAVSCLFQP